MLRDSGGAATRGGCQRMPHQVPPAAQLPATPRVRPQGSTLATSREVPDWLGEKLVVPCPRLAPEHWFGGPTSHLLGPGLSRCSTGRTRPGGTGSPWPRGAMRRGRCRGAGRAQHQGRENRWTGEWTRVQARPEEAGSHLGPVAAQAPWTASGTSGAGRCGLPAFSFNGTPMSQLWCGRVVSPGGGLLC